ncbi:retron-type reverse transcriptase [Catenulispora sp. MAP5-51]|uniref:hypothetical protein n=1 Tax=Catenulispora sp. MAP5-51 TaxID=3156298 RepID=UPI0035168B17
MQPIQDLESDVLGAHFPPSVKAVEIPKAHGPGKRTLGAPTLADRIAQSVVARVIEVEP